MNDDALYSLFEHCPAKPRIEYLEKKDEAQNGTMRRIEEKVDKLLFRTVAGLAAVVLCLMGAIVTMVCSGS